MWACSYCLDVFGISLQCEAASIVQFATVHVVGFEFWHVAFSGEVARTANAVNTFSFEKYLSIAKRDFPYTTSTRGYTFIFTR